MALKKEKIQEIELKAMDVLSELKQEEIVPPIDVTKILRNFSLILKIASFKESNVSGAFDRKTGTIFVAESDSYKRQSFTIAHEIGHYLLHEDKIVDTFYRTDVLRLGEKKNTKEQEADWFAAALLMPKPIVERFWTISGDVEQMARLFNVSVIAMQYRLKNLGLID